MDQHWTNQVGKKWQYTNTSTISNIICGDADLYHRILLLFFLDCENSNRKLFLVQRTHNEFVLYSIQTRWELVKVLSHKFDKKWIGIEIDVLPFFSLLLLRLTLLLLLLLTDKIGSLLYLRQFRANKQWIHYFMNHLWFGHIIFHSVIQKAHTQTRSEIEIDWIDRK